MAQRIAVVTGAGTGIGRSVALRLISDGYAVVGVGRRRDALEQAARSFGTRREHFQGRAADVSDYDSLTSAIGTLPRIDTLVANAGIVRQARLADGDALDVWRSVLAVNLDGVFNTLRVAEPRIASPGRIVIISSGLGKLGRAGFGAYCASKHAVLGLMKCVAKELAARRITVNAVCPGWVDTEMASRDVEHLAHDSRRSPADVKADIVGDIALHRFVAPEEVADLIGFLISDQAAAITGEAFNISCGEFFA